MSTTPEAPSMEATRLMREHKAGALPVVRDEQLVGVITERDFLDTASKILEEAFDEEEPEQAAEGGEAR